MSTLGTVVDRIDPFAKRSLKKKQKKSQGSSRYRTGGDVEITQLALLKGKKIVDLTKFFDSGANFWIFVAKLRHFGLELSKLTF